MKIIGHNIYVGNDLFNNAAFLIDLLPTPNILLVSDHNVANLHLNKISALLAQYSLNAIQIQAGEESKTWSSVETILSALAHYQHDRDSTLISLGGGVVGDLCGLAASIYMRGINWLQIPTTLLAQVDAAVGGKTGCNHLGIKNLIGTFYQPMAVLADITLLRTLSNREYRSGLAEVIKYGVVCDAEFFSWLENNQVDIINRDEQALQFIVARCCAIKQEIVNLDERDQKQRMILNFGHSFGHALEAATDFKYYLHGEAVAIGMLLASQLAVKIGLLDQVILNRLACLVSNLNLQIEWNKGLCSPSMLLDYMMYDKKKRAGKLNLILPCALGKALIISEPDVPCIEDVLQNYG